MSYQDLSDDDREREEWRRKIRCALRSFGRDVAEPQQGKDKNERRVSRS